MRSLLLILCIVISQTLNAEVKVLAFAGSTRTDSYNKKLIHNAANLATELGASVTVVDLKDYPIPFYDADLEKEQGMPANAKKLRDLMMQSQVVFIASPQYNASVSAVLKNAIDWASRNEQGKHSRDAFQDKKFVLMSASTGKRGGAKGLIHLRTILEDAGANVIAEQISVPNAGNAFDDSGKLKDPALQQELGKLITEALKQ